ncbi:MAG: hypothetical protein KHW81_16040 [[Clostridium] innocuum]|nr:hypothetical protein [[Clostridium] innocuum]MBS5685883.1 hypothetical protein [[Clostridium] innocuum]
MFNFKKTSIFQHREEVEEPQYSFEDIPRESHVLAVWGSPGCGKTATATKLAQYLASRKKDVAIVYCDMMTPMMHCVCPPSELEELHSLGSVLSAVHPQTPLIRANTVCHRRNSHLVMLGLKKGENMYSYPAFDEQIAEEFLENIRELAPYVILDCSSYIAFDVLSAISLMKADAVLRMVSCDLKGVSYLASQLPLLVGESWTCENHIKVAGDVRKYQAVDNLSQAMGGLSYQIPHADEVEQQFLSGNLYKDLAAKQSKSFQKTIEKIAEEVFHI